MAGLTEAGAAIKTGMELVQLAQEQGWIDKLRNVFRQKHRVLVLGSTGAGKTNLLQSLPNHVAEAIHYMARTQFAEKMNLGIEGTPFVFVDTPGQEIHKSRRSAAIRDLMHQAPFGVLNVVAYGYHEYRIGKEEAASSDESIREQFLARHRQIEIAAVSEWVDLLGDQRTTKWFITVVSKADLWWDRRQEVMNFYENGPYSAALGPMHTVNPIVSHYCSVFHKFFEEVPMAGTFDDTDRVRARNHLLKLLLQAAASS